MSRSANLDAVLHAASVGTWEWDIASGAVSWSPTLEAIHGFGPGEFARSFDVYASHIHEEDRASVLAAIQEAVRSGSPYELEYRMHRKDGSLHWVAARGTVFRGEDQAPARMVGLCMDITPQKELEDELREQGRIARMLAAESDLELILQAVTDAATRLSGARFGAFVSSGEAPSWAGSVGSELAVPVRARDGEVIGRIVLGHEHAGAFTERSARVLDDLANQAAIAIANAGDRDALRRNKDRYRSLVEASARLIWISSPTGQPRDLSQWAAATGQSADDVAAGRGIEAVHPDDRERTLRAWRDALATGRDFEAEYRVKMDGAYRWFAARATAVRETDGSIREWVGALTDIHDRHRYEQTLEVLAKAHEILASSLDFEVTLRNLTRVLVPDVADWCAVDLVGEEGYERLVVAHVDPEKVALAEDLRNRFPPRPEEDQVAQVLRTGQPLLVGTVDDAMLEAAAYDEEHLAILRQLGLASALIVPLTARGRTLGAITLVSAESARRYDERDLEFTVELARRASLAIDNARLYREAQEANRAKDEFLATLSHELRTPMTAILGWARLLATAELDPRETAEAVATIERSAVLQATLIDDVLDVSRIIRGKLQLDVAPVDLRAVCLAAIETVRPAADARDVSIRVACDEVPRISGDDSRIQQVVWNLLSNAIKFTPRGGTASLRLENAGSHARIEVSDDGRGIPADFLPYVFEPFRQLDGATTRSHSGLGLGLAIARYLTELHGGTITATSEGPGRGATFVVELPMRTEVTAGPQTSVMVTDEGPRGVPTFPDLTGIRIAVVDDHDDTRHFISSVLERCGAVPRAAGSAEEAIAFAGDVDVLISDIAMPRLDGYGLIRQWRALPFGSSTPAVALTAFGTPEDEARALDAGFDAYLKKPIDPVNLARTVAALARR